MSEIIRGLDGVEVVLGRCLGSDGYCCTNIGLADLFLMIMPRLKDAFDSDMAASPNLPMFSNELSPAVVVFKGGDGRVAATYKREVVREIPTRISRACGYPTYVPAVMHNVVVFGDSSDTAAFVEKCRELSNGAIDFWKLSEAACANGKSR